MRTILHADMDAFFASVELLAHPEWRGKPVIVGAAADERGVVSTCSYEARRFGVHSAMPSRTAFQLCPTAIFTPPHFQAYEEVSRRVFEIFEHYTPYVEGVSIDEAFLDVTGSLHLFGNDPAVAKHTLAERLRAEVREKCGVTCSVGVAPNRLLAKIGSDLKKPDGLTILPSDPEEIAEFLAPRKLKILWGVGERTAALLAPYGITTCGDVQRLPVEKLAAVLGSELSAQTLRDYAFGRDLSPVAWEPSAEKSVSREHTFDEDEPRREAVRERLLELAADVGRRFRGETRWARTAFIKVRDLDFNTFTRQSGFPTAARDDFAFRELALALFDEAFPPDRPLPKPLRLIGFGVTNFQASPTEDAPALFADPEDERRRRRERLSSAIDRLHERGYGI